MSESADARPVDRGIEPGSQAKQRRRLRFIYALCVTKLALHALDAASVPTMPLDAAVALAVFIALLMEAFRVRDRWKASRWRGLGPIVVCSATLLGGGLGSGLWLRLCMAGRLLVLLPEYDATADAICEGQTAAEFGGRRTLLGFWGHPVHREGKTKSVTGFGDPDLPIEAAAFLTVSHGFGGHGGYLRLCRGVDASQIWVAGRHPGMWRAHREHFGRWYLVFE